MEINGEKISIRTFEQSDVVPFYEAAVESVEHMYKFMPWCHPNYSMGESESWVSSRREAWEQAGEYSFVICSNADKAILGGVAINQINSIHKVGNVGYWVRRSALNQGVATEAVSLITGFAFSSLALIRLEIVTLPDNLACRKVAEKVGAKYEGVLQNRLVVHNRSLDACMYSLAKQVGQN